MHASNLRSRLVTVWLLFGAALTIACGTSVAPNASASPSASTSSTSATVTGISGTWAVYQAETIQQVDSPVVENALSAPHLRGYSLRVPWSAIDGSTALLDAGLAAARKHGVAFAIRFMAGRWTPSRVFDAGSPYYSVTTDRNGPKPSPFLGSRAPTPFMPDGSPNRVFENAYAQEVATLAAWCRGHGVNFFHMAWWGQDWDELNNGSEVIAQPGYSYQAWLSAHERLFDIAWKNAGSDLAIEFPLSGHGSLAQADADLASYIASKTGGNTQRVFVQANGLNPQPWGIGDWGTNSQATEQQKNAAVWPKAIGRGEQMDHVKDYDWTPIYAHLRQVHAVYVEIYVDSFRTTLPHHQALLASIAAFAA
jgi:hypothetical protein